MKSHNHRGSGWVSCMFPYVVSCGNFLPKHHYSEGKYTMQT